MATRGSKLQHKNSTNPFYATSNEIYGLDFDKKREFVAPKLDNNAPRDSSHSDTKKVDTSYMYAKSSSSYGDGVPVYDMTMSSKMDKRTVMKAVADNPVAVVKVVDTRSPASPLGHPDEAQPMSPPEAPGFAFQPKKEHPLFQTSNNTVGSKEQALKNDNKSFSKPNVFTNSFGTDKYRDTGLSTSLTRSKVHSALDRY